MELCDAHCNDLSLGAIAVMAICHGIMYGRGDSNYLLVFPDLVPDLIWPTLGSSRSVKPDMSSAQITWSPHSHFSFSCLLWKPTL